MRPYALLWLLVHRDPHLLHGRPARRQAVEAGGAAEIVPDDASGGCRSEPSSKAVPRARIPVGRSARACRGLPRRRCRVLRDPHLAVRHADCAAYKVLAEGVRGGVVLEHRLLRFHRQRRRGPASKNSTSGATLGIQMRIGHHLPATKLFHGAFNMLAPVPIMGGLEEHLALFRLPLPAAACSWSYVVYARLRLLQRAKAAMRTTPARAASAIFPAIEEAAGSDATSAGRPSSSRPIPSRSVTVPASPSTRIFCSLRRRRVATPVPSTAGIPYSRATMELWLKGPPTSVTTAEAMAKSDVHAGVVMAATSTSPGRIWLKSPGPPSTRAAAVT